jgi:hypothetical protein
MNGQAGAVAQIGTAHDVQVGDRHDRRGVFALLVVVVVVVSAGVAVIWRLTREPDPSGRPAAATELRLQWDCQSGWVVPDPGDAPIPYSGKHRPVNAVLGTGGEVVVTVQGLSGTSVVLQSARVEVVGRASARTGAYLPSKCQSEVEPRYFRLDLAAATPELEPWAVEGEPPTFPFRVDDVEPEQFVITPLSPNEDVAWRLHIRWTSGADEGELVVDDRGEPFRTTGIGNARPFCLAEESAQWQPSC